MSKKYGALGDYLRRQTANEVPMTFAEIERIIGSDLPPNSQHYPAWWSNSPWNNVMTKVWLDAGFKSERIDIEGRKLVFRRVEPVSEMHAQTHGRSKGVSSDEAREFNPAAMDGEKKQGTSPLWGALKGTFTIEPGYDLTSPMYTDEEWDEILEAKLAKFDKLYADMEVAKDKTEK